MKKCLNVTCAGKSSVVFLDAGLNLHLNSSKSNSAKTCYTGSITTLRTHIKRLGGEHYEMYHHSCHENGVTVHKAAVPDKMKGTESGKEMQQSITRYTQAEQKSAVWDKDISIELSGTWYFSNFFFVIFHDFLCCFTLSTFFSLRFILQEKTIRVLLMSRRSQAQRTTTTDDPFEELSKRPSLWVVLQVHLSLVAPRDLPQQDVSFFTR